MDGGDSGQQFVWIRASSGAEGFLNTSYLLPPQPVGEMVVERTDGKRNTMLRQIATTSRDPGVMVASRA